MRLWSPHSSPEDIHKSFVHLMSFFCLLFDKPSELRFSSSSDAFARCGTCYRQSATSPPNALWAVGILETFNTSANCWKPLHHCKSLTDLHLYSSTDAEFSLEMDEALSSEISPGLSSSSSPVWNMWDDRNWNYSKLGWDAAYSQKAFVLQ